MTTELTSDEAYELLEKMNYMGLFDGSQTEEEKAATKKLSDFLFSHDKELDEMIKRASRK